MILSFRTDRPGQTVQTWSTLFAIPSASFGLITLWPHSSNFWVITTNFLGVRIFRKFTVIILKLERNGFTIEQIVQKIQREWEAQSDQESSLRAQWVVKDPSFPHADSKVSDQTGRMHRLTWVFAGRTLTLLVLSCCGSYVLANTGEPDQTAQSDQGLQCLPFSWHLLDKLLYIKTTLFKIKDM